MILALLFRLNRSRISGDDGHGGHIHLEYISAASSSFKNFDGVLFEYIQ